MLSVEWLIEKKVYKTPTYSTTLFISFQIFGIICMATASPAYIGATHFFLFVAVTAFIATLLWTFVYLLGIREVLTVPIHWILTVSCFITLLMHLFKPLSPFRN